MTTKINKKRIIASVVLWVLALGVMCFIFVASGTRSTGLEKIGKTIAKGVALQTEPGELAAPEHNGHVKTTDENSRNCAEEIKEKKNVLEDDVSVDAIAPHSEEKNDTEQHKQQKANTNEKKIDDYLGITNVAQISVFTKVNYFLRKSFHVFLYGLLAVLVYFAVGSVKLLPHRMFIPTLVSLPVCVLCGILDEYRQTFVVGRSGRVMDVVIDTCGAVLGLVISILAVALYLRRRKRERL